MSAGRFVSVGYPWNATLDVSSPYPARFYLSLIGQTLQYGALASRPGGQVWGRLARRGIPEHALAGALRRSGRVRSADADPMVSADDVAARWAQLREIDPSLPTSPELSVLELTRASATTIFVFGDAPTPLLVCKLARGGSDGVVREAAALREAGPTGLAPRYLGELDGLGHVQRGLPGRALRIVPVSPRRAAKLEWTDEHARLGAALAHLGRSTRKELVPDSMTNGMLERALEHPDLSQQTRLAVVEAAADLAGLWVSVLTHTDTSPQNILFDHGQLVGFVDWADAQTRGLPGADMWNAGLSCIEQGVGLRRWDERELRRSFDVAWFDSEFGDQARRAGRASAEAAGVPAELTPSLELTFFARRLGWRMQHPDAFPTSADLSARVLERVRADSRP